MTLRLQVEFPTGYYHATPWGRHVNEGAVEWPPSPWRLCRALLSTGFRKMGWSTVPEEACSLLGKLSESLPVFHLPEVATGHTRHYMPVYKGSPNKVIDAFVWLGRGGVMGIEWDVDLDARETALLEEALDNLGYLGRAESWVTARVVEEIPEGLPVECAPGEGAPGVHFERLPRLAPMASDAYASWRAEAAQRQRGLRLAKKTEAALEKGRRAPAKLSKKDTERIESGLPRDIVEVLTTDTGELQKQGWSQPPGSRWVSYWLREDALAPRSSPRQLRARATRPTSALIALSPDTEHAPTLPPLRDAVRRGEQLHKTLISLAAKQGGPGACLTGKGDDAALLRGHRHAHILSLVLGGGRGPSARIDHLLVHAPMGLDEAAVFALGRLRRIYAKNLPPVFATLAGLGSADDLRPHVQAMGLARRWESTTPFVPPRHLKKNGKNSLEGQVRAELESRGFPGPETIEVEIQTLDGTDYVDASEVWPLWRQRGGAVTMASADLGETQRGAAIGLAAMWRHFRRERDGDPKPPLSAGFGLRLTFADEVPRPLTPDEPVRPQVLALGYGSHYGLGLFLPAT